VGQAAHAHFDSGLTARPANGGRAAARGARPRAVGGGEGASPARLSTSP
jgi:hypothetical protein